MLSLYNDVITKLLREKLTILTPRFFLNLTVSVTIQIGNGG